MPNKLSSAPSARTFAAALRKEVLEPAAEKMAGADGQIAPSELADSAVLEGKERLAETSLKEAAVALSGGETSTAAFVDAAVARAEAAVATASGGDGRLSQADAQNLPDDLRMAFHYLRSGELPPEMAMAALPKATGVRYSERIFREVMTEYAVTDPQALFDTTLALEDGNKYLKRSELEAAAAELRDSAAGSPAEGYDFSDNVLASVMEEHGIADEALLLSKATSFDLDGNRYLKRSELEAAAKVLAGVVEIGIVSDIDKTLLPPHANGAPLPAPYPGIAQMMRELEFGNGGDAGDMYFVTARSADRVAEIPAWVAEHEIPAGPIGTGVSTLPWVAQGEKVRDISEVFDANPDQSFVLFGDTSHKDPEAYREIKEKYGDRVLAVVMHKVNNPNPARVAGFHLVTDYATAAAKLMQDGLIDDAQALRIMVAAQAGGIDITDAEMQALLESHRPS